MRHRKRKNCNKKAVFVISCLLLANSSLFATAITAGALEFSSVNWYFPDVDEFNIVDKTSGGAAMLAGSTVSTATESYILMGGTMSFDSGSALVSDTSNGDGAYGEFAAGATMTVTGLLYTSTFSLVASGDLIVADIKYNWFLDEQDAPQYDSVTGSIYFDITGGALFSETGNTAGLVLSDFEGYFNFSDCPTTITDFDTTTTIYECGTSASLQISPIPEPSMILLLGLGGYIIKLKGKRLS